MDPAKIVANANSKMCRVELLVEARHRPVVERMADLCRLVDEYRAETGQPTPATPRPVLGGAACPGGAANNDVAPGTPADAAARG